MSEAKPFINKNEIKSRAQGRWLEIIQTIAPFTATAAEHPGVHYPCPHHGGRDGFRFYKDADQTGGGICNSCGNFPDGFALLGWLTGTSFHDVLKDVAEVVGGVEFVPAPRHALPPPVSKVVIELRDKAKRGRLRTAWKESSLSGAPAASAIKTYLKTRGLHDVPENLRFHENMCYRHDDGKTENMPCMLAPVQSADGTYITMHRTYLAPGGTAKADVSCPKKLMSPTSDKTLHGTAIRLYEPNADTLCIAEGIETAIAVHEATGYPAWSSISAAFLETFMPPKNVKRIVVFADKDRSMTGVLAAQKMARNLEKLGIQVDIKVPPSDIPDGKKGIDWLDEYQKHGLAMFPSMV